MAKNTKKKFNALIDRVVSMAASVTDETYEEDWETENRAEQAEETMQPEVGRAEKPVRQDFFDFEKESESLSTGKTRKINSVEVSRFLDAATREENENTMVFKIASDDAPQASGRRNEDADATHVFGKIFSDGDSEAEDKDADDGYKVRKIRPIRRNRHYRTGCMGGIMYFLVIVCVSMTLAALGWLAANDVLSLNKEPVTAEITVSEDFTIEEVAQQLEDNGIIEYSFLFKLFSKLSTAEEKITPGTYTLSSHLDYRAIVTNLKETSGPLKTVEVTIPEGRTMIQTFQLLEDNGVCDLDVLLECASSYEFDYDFLDPDKFGTEKRLEGYLFPDTYEFYVDSDPDEAIEKFLDNFERRVKEHMYERAEEMGYTFDEIMTIASMIEMESASDSERTLVSSVIYNRLKSYDFPRLQIDATVQYALGERKESLSYEDLQVDSPYNTYLYEGLPPGPISNPGITSIGAALNPDSTSYYYYALSTDGTHRFFTYYSSFREFVDSSEYGG